MTEEQHSPVPENRFLQEISEYVSDSPIGAFIPLLTQNILRIIQENLTKDYTAYIQENISPALRNIEVQSALQVSKTNESFSDLKKVNEHIMIQLSKLNDSLNQLKSQLASHSEKIESVQKLAAKKADLFELQTVAKELTTMTPLNTFYNFQEWTKTLASKAETERLDSELETVKIALQEKPSFEYVQNENSKIIVEVKSVLMKDRTVMMRKIGKVKESLIANNEKLEMVQKKNKQSSEILSKKINEVMEFVTNKPWTEDLSLINEELYKRATKSELQEMRNVQDPKFEELLRRSAVIEKELKEYTDVLARFDEVILTKSSKEDIKVLHQKLKSLVTSEKIDPLISEFSAKFVKISEKLNTHSIKIEEVSKDITSYAAISALLKTQTKDYTKIMDSLKTLSETLKFKADKSDIYNIFDVVGYREDVLALSNAFEKLKELFTQSVVLQHEAIGTFVPSVDPQVTKNRLRTEIGKNLDIIIKRLQNSSEHAESFSGRVVMSKKRLVKMESVKMEAGTEDGAMTARNQSLKHKRVVSAAGHKRFL